MNNRTSKNTIDTLLELPRPQKRIISILFDSIAIGLTITLAVAMRENGLPHFEKFRVNEYLVFLSTIFFSIFIFSRIGLYRAILRYMSSDAIQTVLIGSVLSTVVFAAATLLTRAEFSRGSVILYFLLILVTVGGPRFFVRRFIQIHVKQGKESVIIFGAGSAGRQLASALALGNEYTPVAMIDEDPTLYRSKIHGITVFSLIEMPSLIANNDVKKVLLAIPSATRARRLEIIKHLETFPVQVQTIAGMSDIVSGKSKIEELRNIDIDDLLGRDTVPPNDSLLDLNIFGKAVMVTGAGGSIGSELCRQIVTRKPSLLLLFEVSEFALYAIEQDLIRLKFECQIDSRIIPILGSVQNRASISSVMSAYNINTVYHAAAYKHVPMVEANIIEGVKNNIFGTWFTAQAAIEANVDTFVLISTDKAVRSTNVMGASKRMAELCLQALADREVRTHFCMVRFGNVLGSSGSVVPLFKQQIESGGPITVTHQDIIRYFMTIPEAAQLVIQAGAMAKGGEVFVLDMGEPVRIFDLALRMIKLMGLHVKDSANPSGDIEIHVSGLRPGEKLYEELLIGDNVSGTNHSRIMCAEEKKMSYKEFLHIINEIQNACAKNDADLVRELLVQSPADFQPSSHIVDALWCQLGGRGDEKRRHSIVSISNENELRKL